VHYPDSSSLYPHSLRRRLHAVGVHHLHASCFCTESSPKPTCSGDATLVFKQSLLIESSGKPTCSTWIQAVSTPKVFGEDYTQWGCITWIQPVSPHRVFHEAYMQWECVTWIQAVSPHRVFGEDNMQWGCICCIQAASPRSLRWSLLAVWVPNLNSSCLCRKSSAKTTCSGGALQGFNQSLLIEAWNKTTRCGVHELDWMNLYSQSLRR